LNFDSTWLSRLLDLAVSDDNFYRSLIRALKVCRQQLTSRTFGPPNYVRLAALIAVLPHPRLGRTIDDGWRVVPVTLSNGYPPQVARSSLLVVAESHLKSLILFFK
jgi:hypothetical protein